MKQSTKVLLGGLTLTIALSLSSPALAQDSEPPSAASSEGGLYVTAFRSPATGADPRLLARQPSRRRWCAAHVQRQDQSESHYRSRCPSRETVTVPACARMRQVLDLASRHPIRQRTV